MSLNNPWKLDFVMTAQNSHMQIYYNLVNHSFLLNVNDAPNFLIINNTETNFLE